MAKAKAKAPAKGTGIEARLANIDVQLKAKLVAVADSLANGAKPAAIDKLGKLFGGSVPADVRAWFAWHDGQREDAFESLIPDTNWSALSCKRVAETHKFLSTTARDFPDDIMLPYEDSWIPLFDNGGGDHLCFDRESGKIVTWYHDDKSRPIAYKSFAALVEDIDKGYTKMKAVAGIPAPAVKKWKAVAKKPSEKQIEATPIGGAYTTRSEGFTYVFAKLGDDRWLGCFGQTREAAIESWKKHAIKPPAENSGYYKRTWDVWFAIKYAKQVSQGT